MQISGSVLIFNFGTAFIAGWEAAAELPMALIDRLSASPHPRGLAGVTWMDGAFTEQSYAPPSGWGVSRRSAGLVFLVLTAVFLVSLLNRPPDGDYFSICLFKSLTGLPCPACGLTHSFCALAKGHIARALGYNVLGPPIFVLAVGFWFRSAAVVLGRMRAVTAFDRVARGAALARMLLLAFGVYGVGRIVYIVAFAPQLIQSAPLLKLIIGLFASG